MPSTNQASERKHGLRFITKKTNITHVMTHDWLSVFPFLGCAPLPAGWRVPLLASFLHPTVFFPFPYLSFVFLDYYYEYFISTMLCLPLLWSLWSTVFVFVLFETLYQSYHSIPSLTLRALLSAPPTRHWLAEIQVRPPSNLASPIIHRFKLVLKFAWCLHNGLLGLSIFWIILMEACWLD